MRIAPMIISIGACASPPPPSPAAPSDSSSALSTPDAATKTRAKDEGPLMVGPNDEGKVIEASAGASSVTFAHPGVLDKTVKCIAVKFDKELGAPREDDMHELVWEIPRRPGIGGRHEVTVECAAANNKTTQRTSFAIVVMWH